MGAAAEATGGFFFGRIANQSLKRMIAIRTAILEDRHEAILVKIGAAFNVKQKQRLANGNPPPTIHAHATDCLRRSSVVPFPFSTPTRVESDTGDHGHFPGLVRG